MAFRPFNTEENNKNNLYNNSKNNTGIFCYNSERKEDNIILASNIKLLKHKLEDKEKKIKSMQINMDSLKKENENLKHYIIQLQQGSLNDKNNSDNNIDKIMYSINYFIKQMYNLFPSLGNKDNYKDLKYDQNNEIQQNLSKIESAVNEILMQKTKKITNNTNDNSISDMIPTIEYTKLGKKKPKINRLIKKLENKGSKKKMKKSKKEDELYYNYDYTRNNRIKSHNKPIKKYKSGIK